MFFPFEKLLLNVRLFKLRLNLSKLCLEYRGLFFPGHVVFPGYCKVIW